MSGGTLVKVVGRVGAVPFETGANVEREAFAVPETAVGRPVDGTGFIDSVVPLGKGYCTVVEADEMV